MLPAILLVFGLSPGLSVAATPEPAACESLEASRQEVEEFLRRAEVVEKTELAVGVTRSHRLTLRDDTQTMSAVWKTIDEHAPLKRFYDGGLPEIGFLDSYKSEIAAYELDKMIDLGMVPPTVERKLDRRTGSLQLWMEGCITEATRRRRGLHPPDGSAWGAQVYKYRLFHQLIHDTDYRNHANLLVDESGFRIWVIDHSRAFRIQGRLLETDYLRRFSRTLLEKLRGLEEQRVEEELGRWLSRGQRKALLERRDLLLAHADRLVAERGEAAILY